MTNSIILVHLLVSIAIIMVLILKFKTNPVISLVLGALYMGFASGIAPMDTIKTITEGFGNLMKGIGISVGFGIMLGQLVADSGAVQTIANTLTRVAKKEKSDYALGVTGFIVSTPVFYDVGYVILTPLARVLSKNAKTLPHFVGALVAGLGVAHTFVPPTPGPMTGGELLGIELGITLFWGLVVAFPTFLLSLYLYDKLFLSNKKFWNPQKDEDAAFNEEQARKNASDTIVASEDKQLSFGAAMLPILLPVVLILLGTVTKAALGTVPVYIQFISDRNIAMLAGVFAAILVAKKVMTGEQIEKSINMSLASAGIVLLITGSGGAFGNVLAKAGVGDVLTAMVSGLKIHPIILTWFIASLLKFAQGSGTVAMITSVSIIAPAVSSMGVAPILVALAAFSGSLFGAHVNDSGFWITAKVAGLTTSGGLKTYTTVTALQSIISLAIIMALSLFL